MASVRIPLILGTSGGTPVESAPHRLYNMYPVVDSLNKVKGHWKNTPGWDSVECTSNCFSLKIKKAIEYRSKLWVIASFQAEAGHTVHGLFYLIQQSEGYVAYLLLNMGAEGTEFDMATDGVSIVISDGVTLWGYNEAGFEPDNLEPIEIEHSIANPTGVIFHNGHYIAISGGTGQFYISDKFQGDKWDGLQFTTAEDSPDNITQLFSDRVLLVFGDKTTQVYDNRGGDDILFPFFPNQQGRMLYGIAGKTAARANNGTYWLSRNESGGHKVLWTNGLVPKAISTPQIEDMLSGLYSDDAFARSIQWKGREWYVLSFPTERRTFVYDIQGAWFEWGNWDTTEQKPTGHPMLDYVYFNGRHLFVDGTNTIKELKDDVYKHGDETMLSMFVTGVQHANERRIFLNALTIDMRGGTGGSMDLSVSKDGGNTFGSWVRRSLGKVGSYQQKIKWHRLGSGYNMVLRGRITDEVPREIINGVLDVNMMQTAQERKTQFGLNNA